MNLLLSKYMEHRQGWGNAEGQKVYAKLVTEVEAHPSERIFSISLEDILRTDVSFPRSSVIMLARTFKQQRGFCLTDIADLDLRENWEAAATRLEQPITIWEGEKGSVIGLEPSEGTRQVLEFVLAQRSVTTVDVTTALDLKTANASNKLKELYERGFVLRQEKVSSSGGIEFSYYRIK